jgi:hypothetical protein
MKIIRVIFVALVSLVINITSQGQDCKDFHKSNDCYVYVPLDRDYQIYNQAKSTFAEVGKPTLYKVVLYGKKDFIVGVCAESSYYRKIRLRIIDGITKKVLYDNKDYDYIESFGFTIEKTQPLDLEITVLTKDKATSAAKICVGIQILWSKVVEKGTGNK